MNHKNSLLSALVLMFVIRKTSASGTKISGLWTDDYHHSKKWSANDGWFDRNKMWSDSLNKFVYTRLSNVLTTGSDGTIYYGPLQIIPNATSGNNYFKRKFTCTTPANTVIIQFQTAICEGDNHETDASQMQINIDDQRNYRSHLDSNTTEGAYELTDDVLKTQCHNLTHSDNFYWIQSHSTKLTVDYMNNNITKHDDFVVTFRINVRNNDAALLYGITVECAVEIGPDDTGSSGSSSKHVPDMIDCGYDCDDAGHKFMIKIGTTFGILIGICAILLIAYKCIKHIRLKSQVKYRRELNLNQDDNDSIIDDSFAPIM